MKSFTASHLSSLIFIYLLLLISSLSFANVSPNFDTLVSGENRGRFSKEMNLPFLQKVRVRKIVVVNPNGGGDFITISDAIAAAGNNTVSRDGYYVIHLTSGVYKEYVLIPKYKRYLMVLGDAMDQTVITGNRSNADGWGTLNSATFSVEGDGFVGINITIENTAGPIKQQAVALRNKADSSAFYGCRFKGYQDTLLTHYFRQFYRGCEIYGTIDFIFGYATVVLQNCKMFVRKPLAKQFNTITAHGRLHSNDSTGISMQNCTIVAEENLGSIKSYLGRPWKEYSRTIVMQSFIDDFIDPMGWSPWNKTTFALSTLYYAEFDNRGPGSNTSNRITWPGFHLINA